MRTCILLLHDWSAESPGNADGSCSRLTAIDTESLHHTTVSPNASTQYRASGVDLHDHERVMAGYSTPGLLRPWYRKMGWNGCHQSVHDHGARVEEIKVGRYGRRDGEWRDWEDA